MYKAWPNVRSGDHWKRLCFPWEICDESKCLCGLCWTAGHCCW